MHKQAVARLIIGVTLSIGSIAMPLNSAPLPLNSAGRRRPITLSFLGDMLAHYENYIMADYSLIWRHMEPLFAADDLTFINLETPVDDSTAMSNYPVFNVHSPYLEAAASAGIDFFSFVNNHTFDRGRSGAIATVEKLAELAEQRDSELHYGEIAVTGDINLQRPYSFVSGGWHIGFVAATQFSNAPAHNRMARIINYGNADQSRRFIEFIEENAPFYDLFIVSYHGGTEYALQTAPEKELFFTRLIAAGADIVWGHHPHVMQPITQIKRADGDGLIMRSMGNTISGQIKIVDPWLPSEEWSYVNDSLLLQVTLTPNRNSYQMSVHAVPISNYLTPDSAIIVAPLQELILKKTDPDWRNFLITRYTLLNRYFMPETD